MSNNAKLFVSGRKKKPAPPPPPVTHSASSVNSAEKPSPIVASQLPNSVETYVEPVNSAELQIVRNESKQVQLESGDHQGKFPEIIRLRRKLFRPLLEYRQLPLRSRKCMNVPLTLGQLYKNEISTEFIDCVSSSDEEISEDGVDDCKQCTERSKISVKSFVRNQNYFDDTQDSFEMKLSSHTNLSMKRKVVPLDLKVLFDNRVGEYV